MLEQSVCLFLLNFIQQDRWTDVVTPLASQINATITQIIKLLPESIRDELMTALGKHAVTICSNFPYPYGDEIMFVNAPLCYFYYFYYI